MCAAVQVTPRLLPPLPALLLQQVCSHLLITPVIAWFVNVQKLCAQHREESLQGVICGVRRARLGARSGLMEMSRVRMQVWCCQCSAWCCSHRALLCQ